MQATGQPLALLNNGYAVRCRDAKTKPVSLSRIKALGRTKHKRSGPQQRPMTTHAQASAAGPRQMLQLEGYSLPEWAKALSDHVGILSICNLPAFL